MPDLNQARFKLDDGRSVWLGLAWDTRRHRVSRILDDLDDVLVVRWHIESKRRFVDHRRVAYFVATGSFFETMLDTFLAMEAPDDVVDEYINPHTIAEQNKED